eukprot:1173101-Prymnesium_polylepis.1
MSTIIQPGRSSDARNHPHSRANCCAQPPPPLQEIHQTSRSAWLQPRLCTRHPRVGRSASETARGGH